LHILEGTHKKVKTSRGHAVGLQGPKPSVPFLLLFIFLQFKTNTDNQTEVRCLHNQTFFVENSNNFAV
jgi:hypothetical protein